jgi:hypothetical protein
MISIGTDDQVIFSSILQWSLYGNHPGVTSAIGMSIVVVAGLYGVVSMTIRLSGLRADT